jgi:hypothetical protein
MLILYHDGVDITWTFNFATDGSIQVSKPGDSADLPLSVTEAGEVTATVATGASFYVSVNAMLQVTIPEGFVANTMGWSREEFAAGDVYTFDDYHPMINSEELLQFTNVGEADAELVLNFAEYVYVNPNPDLEGKGTQDDPYVLNPGDVSVVCDATNGVIFAYYFYGTADTLEFTNLNNVKIFSASASMAGIMPNEEVSSFTNTNMEFVVYFIVYTIDETQPATFTVTFTEAPSADVE